MMNLLWYTINSLRNYSNYSEDFWKNSVKSYLHYHVLIVSESASEVKCFV